MGVINKLNLDKFRKEVEDELKSDGPKDNTGITYEIILYKLVGF